MTSTTLGLLLGSAALLGGCGTLSGLDASSSFSCKAAPGVTCQSISGVHQNAAAGNLPFQRQSENGEKAAQGDQPPKDDKTPLYGGTKTEGKVSPRDMDAAYSGLPVRQPPLVLRVWMAPYEDDSGDLHDQSYFYTVVHSGKWMIEANRNTISGQFRPIYPLNKPTQSKEPTPSGSEKKLDPLVQSGSHQSLANKPEAD